MPRGVYERKPVDITGQVFNRWEVVGPGPEAGEWNCRCSCLKGGERVLTRIQLSRGMPKSCGCLRTEAAHLNRDAARLQDSRWTVAKTSELVAIYENHTRQRTAELLGPSFTKNMVISKLDRLGLCTPVPDAPKPHALALSLYVPWTCMWPHGNPGEDGFHFCGAKELVEGKPYCAKHVAIAYIKISKGAAGSGKFVLHPRNVG